jgi:hypothetical protein
MKKKSFFASILIFFCLLFSGLTASSFELKLNEQEKNAIRDIISSMGQKNFAFLILNSGHLTELGNRIDHVHPLQFMGFILSDPFLKKCLQNIHENYFKWSAFVDGFAGGMERELMNQTLYPELEKFAPFIGKDYQILLRFVYAENWKGFIECLI